MAEEVINADRNGTLQDSGSGGAYATVHDEATGFAQTWTTTTEISQSTGDDIAYAISRGGLVFDTSVIPAGATITSAVLSLYGWTKLVDVDFSITVVNGDDIADNYPDPAYNDFVDGDYGDLLNQTTSYGSMLASNFQVSTPTPTENQITLNASGIAEINIGGITKFGIRSSRDINSNAPTAGNNEYIRYTGCDGSYPPKLTITYTPAWKPQVIFI